MSDQARRITGLILIPVSVLLICCSLLPFPEKHTGSFAGKGIREISETRIPHLDSMDPINTGDAETLCGFPGIGEAIAQMVIDEREKNGLFVYPEDIMSVSGIGIKKLEKIRPYLHLDIHESGE